MKRPQHLLLALCVLLLAWSAPACAQNDPLYEVDSVGKVIAADTAAYLLLPSDASRKWPVELQARTPHEKAVAGIAKGILLAARSEYDTAAKVLDGVIDLLGGTSHQRVLAVAHLYRGKVERGRNNIAGAIVQYERALQITARDPYPKLDALLQKAIAQCYDWMGFNSKARAHCMIALSLPLSSRDRYGILSWLAKSETKDGLFTDALRHSQQMSALADSSADISNAFIRVTSGELALAQGKYAEAADHFKSALEQYKTKHDFAYQADILGSLSRTYLMAGQPALAIKYAREGLLLSVQKGLPVEAQDNEGALFQAYAAAGNKAAAYDHLVRFITLRDSSNGAAASGILAASMLRTEMARQARTDSLLRAEKDLRLAEKHHAEVQRERTKRNIFLFAGIALACFTTVALRQRAKIKKERDRSEMLLLNILPEEVAEELKAKGEAEAQLIDQVTVLFTDFKGFTAMSEKMSPKQLVHDLHECFSAFDNICECHGIEKIKTIGDAYMAAGGLPVPNATNATDCINAALEMRDFIAEGKARKIAAGLPFFEIRIGIHTGPVVAGIVGVKKFQYDIWGDTVNTASRMESSGVPGEVNVSGRTYTLVQEQAGASAPLSVPAFAFTPRGKIHAKGKGEMEMYFVERAAA